MQLRWNRMNPNGSAAVKKAASAAVSSGPAQPKMTAFGRRTAACIGLLDKKAPDVATLQLGAQLLGSGGIGDRSGLNPVEDTALAKVRPDRPARKTAEQGRIPALPPLPFP